MSAELPLESTPPVIDDVRTELEFHIEQRAAELEALGMPHAQALTEARALFGDRDTIEAECRTIEQRRRDTKERAFRLHSLGQDIVLGFRLLRKSPLFALSAILTLAIGIGANAAVFSLVNHVILQPLGFPQANRLMTVTERHNEGWGNLAWATFVEIEQRSRTFTALAAYGSDVSTVLGTATPLRVPTAYVSSNFFSVFGARAERGRLPMRAEHREGGNRIAVVSHALWRDHLGAPATLTGVQIKLDVVYDVIGVVADGFTFPENAQIWTPLELDQQSTSHTAHNWQVSGRLREGVTPASAQRELDELLKEMGSRYAPDFDAVGSTVTPLQEALTADLRTPLYLLFAASAVLLLAACTNLASAQLARGAARAGELAVRSALGASRGRLVRQLLTESALLAFLGAGAGLLLSRVLLRAFTLSAPDEWRLERVPLDGWVLLFALVVAGVTALGFGLLPALRLSDSATMLLLREVDRGTGSRRSMRLWHVIVASEIALALTLLSGSQVLIRSFVHVMRTDLGFDPADVRTSMVNLPIANYGDSVGVAVFHESVLARLRNTAGVSAVGFANRLPLEGGYPNGAMEVEGKPLNARGKFNGSAVYRVIGGEYFTAMGIPVLEGRALGPEDDRSAPRAVVVDEALAKEQWPGQSAIGKRLRPYGMDRDDEPWFSVVGVVKSVRAGSVTEAFTPTYYFDHRQRPAARTRSVSYAVRSPIAAGVVTSIMRREINAVDAQVPVEAGSMARILADVVAVRRFMMLLLSAFASMAILLALVGIYSVVGYTVARRTREIGVRLALGASKRQVLRMILQSGMRGILPGLVAGALLAVAGNHAIRTLLYGVSPQDPVALGTAVVILGVVALVSTLVPARRATRVSPLVAMRAE
jgi:putative ABC transport system permease protein